MLKTKLQYFGYLMQTTDSLEKSLMLGSEFRRAFLTGRGSLPWRLSIKNCKWVEFPVLYSRFSLVIYSMWWLFSHPVVSDSLHLHDLQHVRPLCPSPYPEVCPSSCPLHQWCHPASHLILCCPLLLFINVHSCQFFYSHSVWDDVVNLSLGSR